MKMFSWQLGGGYVRNQAYVTESSICHFGTPGKFFPRGISKMTSSVAYITLVMKLS